METFDVTVPFESIRFEAIGSSLEWELPPTFEIEGVKFRYDADRSLYLADLVVQASDRTSAKRMAAEHIRQILALIALSGDAYRIRFGPDLQAIRRTPHVELVVAGTFVEETEAATGARHIETTRLVKAFSESHLGLKKTRGTVEFECAAFSWREDWPEWVWTALELNYLATTSHEIKPSFVIRYSALELIVDGAAGPHQTILKQRLVERQRRALRKKLDLLLSEFGFDLKEKERLKSSISASRTVSTASRIASALTSLGVHAEEVDVRRVIEQRGAIAHGSQVIDTVAVESAANLARSWVEQALIHVLQKTKAATETSVENG